MGEAVSKITSPLKFFFLKICTALFTTSIETKTLSAIIMMQMGVHASLETNAVGSDRERAAPVPGKVGNNNGLGEPRDRKVASDLDRAAGRPINFPASAAGFPQGQGRRDRDREREGGEADVGSGKAQALTGDAYIAQLVAEESSMVLSVSLSFIHARIHTHSDTRHMAYTRHARAHLRKPNSNLGI